LIPDKGHCFYSKNKIRTTLKNFPFPRINGGFFGLFMFAALAAFSLFSIHACSEPDEIGLGLIDRRAGFNSTDTLSIIGGSVFSEPIPTNFGGQNMLGVMQDPVFGKVKASLFTQFRLTQNNFSLGDAPVLDSLTISFEYSGSYYGQVETFQTLKVYELSEQIPDVDTLFSNISLAHYPDLVAEFLLRPAPTDSVLIDTIMFAPHFRIRLSDELGQKIIDANGTPAFENVPNFLEYFKGLYITVDDEIDGTGSIFNLNMFSFFTRLSLHYRQEGDTVSTRHDFPVTQFTQRTNLFETLSYENAHPLLVEQLFGEEPSGSEDSLLFVQAMGRLRANIQFPFLSRLSEAANVTINQAKLILPVAEGFADELFPVAQELLLLRYDENGKLQPIADMQFGDEYFGGTYEEGKNQYSFNITQHLQQVMNGKVPDKGLTLAVTRAAENARRVVLNGPGVATRPMRLEIIYTVFN
jgi:hypothetical protein